MQITVQVQSRKADGTKEWGVPLYVSRVEDRRGRLIIHAGHEPAESRHSIETVIQAMQQALARPNKITGIRVTEAGGTYIHEEFGA